MSEKEVYSEPGLAGAALAPTLAGMAATVLDPTLPAPGPAAARVPPPVLKVAAVPPTAAAFLSMGEAGDLVLAPYTAATLRRCRAVWAAFSAVAGERMERRGEAPGLAAVTTADVLAYPGSLGGLAPTTRRSRLDALRALLARATAAGLIGADPGAAVHLPALVRQPRHPPLTLTECRHILAAGRERGHRDHVLVVLLLLGLRVGELVGCLVGDLDLDRAELRVHLSKTGARTMALPVAVVAMLEARGHPPADAALVAGRHGGGPITTRQAARIWVSVLAEAGVAPRGPHQGRRAAAARLLWLAPPQVVARHLGHAVGTLMKYYADCAPADLHRAVVADPLFGGGVEPG